MTAQELASTGLFWPRRRGIRPASTSVPTSWLDGPGSNRPPYPFDEHRRLFGADRKAPERLRTDAELRRELLRAQPAVLPPLNSLRPRFTIRSLHATDWYAAPCKVSGTGFVERIRSTRLPAKGLTVAGRPLFLSGEMPRLNSVVYHVFGIALCVAASSCHRQELKPTSSSTAPGAAKPVRANLTSAQMCDAHWDLLTGAEMTTEYLGARSCWYSSAPTEAARHVDLQLWDIGVNHPPDPGPNMRSTVMAPLYSA